MITQLIGLVNTALPIPFVKPARVNAGATLQCEAHQVSRPCEHSLRSSPHVRPPSRPVWPYWVESRTKWRKTVDRPASSHGCLVSADTPAQKTGRASKTPGSILGRHNLDKWVSFRSASTNYAPKALVAPLLARHRTRVQALPVIGLHDQLDVLCLGKAHQFLRYRRRIPAPLCKVRFAGAWHRAHGGSNKENQQSVQQFLATPKIDLRVHRTFTRIFVQHWSGARQLRTNMARRG